MNFGAKDSSSHIEYYSNMDTTVIEDIEVDNENGVEVTNMEDNKKKSKKRNIILSL